MSVQTRRDFLRALGAVAGAALAPQVLWGQAKKRRPNVLLIFTDDQGSIDVNCYGAKDLITPNLDRLVRSGTIFTSAYTSSPSYPC